MVISLVARPGCLPGIGSWWAQRGWDCDWLHGRGRRRCSPRTTARKTAGTTAGRIPHARRSG